MSLLETLKDNKLRRALKIVKNAIGSNKVDENGDNSLIIALRNSSNAINVDDVIINNKIASILMLNPFIRDHKNKDGETPYSIALKNGNITLLTRFHSKKTPIDFSILNDPESFLKHKFELYNIIDAEGILILRENGVRIAHDPEYINYVVNRIIDSDDEEDILILIEKELIDYEKITKKQIIKIQNIEIISDLTDLIEEYNFDEKNMNFNILNRMRSFSREEYAFFNERNIEIKNIISHLKNNVVTEQKRKEIRQFSREILDELKSLFRI